MLPHLGAAAKAIRRRHRVRQIDVALRLGVSESTISHFERGLHWPQSPDITIQAYADELDLEPADLWREALRRWDEQQQQPSS